LIYNSILLAMVTFALSLLSEHPPVVLMIMLLFLNGVISSVQFTAMNSFGYINIAPRLQSAGSSFMSSLQQVASGFSIALAALVLECFLHSSNIMETYSPPSFRYTFMVVALFPLVGVVFFRRLAKD
jgi:hypothetical protein